MPIDYKKTREFVEKGIDPYIQPIKKFFRFEFDKTHASALAADERITNEIIPMEQDVEVARIELDQDLTALEQTLETNTNQLESQITSHLVATNPHQLRLVDLLTVSANDPTNAQGNNDQFWMSYLNPIYSWVVGSWSACSVACGGGIQTRTVQCARSDGTIVEDFNCISAGLVKPDTSRVCNTQDCPVSIALYSAKDDSAILYPTNSSGQIIGAGQSVGGTVSNKNYIAQLKTYDGFVPENGYYYFRVDVTNANSGNNAGVSIYWPDGTPCTKVADLLNGFTFYANGFTDDGWVHPGPWWRFSGSYTAANALFRIPVQ